MPPATRALIVSGADQGFFPLLAGLVRSIRDLEQAKPLSLGFFDLGLSARQRAWLGQYSDLIVTPEWGLRVPEAAADRPGAKSLTGRAFLPELFPGFDLYIWLDADIWMQDSQGLGFYLAGAAGGQLAATPQVDRAYFHATKVTLWRYQGFVGAYGREQAETLMQYPHVNFGAFALEGNAPHWKILVEELQAAVDRSGEVFRAAQMAFNHAIWMRRLPVQLLPATCNWQCHLRLPVWDDETEAFCEPYLPYPTISMLHLTADTKDKAQALRTRAGGTKRMSLRYPRLGSDDPASA